MPNGISTSGFSEFGKQLNKLPKVLFEEANEEVIDAAAHWEELSKRSTKSTRIRQEITSRGIGLMEAEVLSPVEYSPYEEWGTGERAIVPLHLESYAEYWWTRKVHVGRYPDPYFFIQAPLVEKFLVTNLKKLLATSH